MNPRAVVGCALALASGCGAQPETPAPEPVPTRLSDCPARLPEPGVEDRNDLQPFLERQDQLWRIELRRCEPARRECLTACSAYAARCPGPYYRDDVEVQIDPVPVDEFCASACSGRRAPYLTRAQWFRQDAKTCVR